MEQKGVYKYVLAKESKRNAMVYNGLNVLRNISSILSSRIDINMYNQNSEMKL